MEYDVLVLGGGAAGLFCAALAGQRGLRVGVLERATQPGRKILISGGGRCNFTNLRVTAANFLSANPHFAKSALSRYPPERFIELVRRHRIPFHEKKLGQLFCDDSSQRILGMLLKECEEGGVELHTGVHIQAVRKNSRFQVECASGEFHSEKLVVATGGLSIPKIGATDLGYKIAAEFGLRVAPPYPALAPLVFNQGDREAWCGLAGVSCEVTAACGSTRFREKMLITHRGLSGPAILQISSYWRPGQAIQIDLLPETGLGALAPKEARKALLEALPTRLAERFLEIHGLTQPLIPVRKADELLHRWVVRPAGTEGFEKAEVTGGGVSTGDLSSQTMEARNEPGLYFVGEVVDVTGWLGGYNFQWAWASAFAAAQAL